MQELSQMEWNTICAKLEPLLPPCVCSIIAHYTTLTEEEHLDRLFAFPQKFDFQLTNEGIPQTRPMKILITKSLRDGVFCYVQDHIYMEDCCLIVILYRTKSCFARLSEKKQSLSRNCKDYQVPRI
jgi:hypothetical protein